MAEILLAIVKNWLFSCLKWLSRLTHFKVVSTRSGKI
jgi:hypothetical protein